MSPRQRVARTDARFEYFGEASAACSRDFEITTLGLIRVPAGAQYPPSGHPAEYTYRWCDGRRLAEYQVHFITRGIGSLQTEVKGCSQHNVLPGSIFVLFPDVWHRYAPMAGTGWTEFWIGLRGRRVEELMRSRSLSERDPIPLPSNVEQLSMHFARAVSTLESNDLMASEMRRALATLILAELNGVPASESLPEPSLIEKAVRLLHETSTTQMSLEKIAEQLNVGYHSLRQRFKKGTGCTMHQLREELRIKRAALILGNRGFAVKEVAAQCGFADPYYFSRAFRRRLGVSPMEYRQKAFPKSGNRKALEGIGG